MKILPTTPDVAVPLAEFIAAHYPPAREWGMEALLPWVRWNLGESFLAYVFDDGNIVGVGIARPVMRGEDGRTDCLYDQEGPCLFIDLAIATGPLVAAMLVAQMRERFGMRERVAFLRRDRLIVHPLKPWYYRLMRPLFLAFPPSVS